MPFSSYWLNFSKISLNFIVNCIRGSAGVVREHLIFYPVRGLERAKSRGLGWQLFFSSIWGRFDGRFGDLLDSITHTAERIDREAVNLDIAEAAESRKRNAAYRLEQDDRLHTQQFLEVRNWLGIEGSEQTSQEEHLERQLRQCHDGTSGWAVGLREVRNWLQRGCGNPVLWLNGEPGSGECSVLDNNPPFFPIALTRPAPKENAY